MHTKEKKFTSLENDLLFKEALSHPDNRYMLIYVIKTLLGIDEKIIKNNLQVSYEYNIRKSKINDKNMRGDIVILFDEYIINLECYSYFTNESLNKSISYVLRLFGNQINAGNKYNLKKIIQINIIDKVKIHLNNELKTKYQIINEKDLNDIILKENLQIRFYQIEKYEKKRIENKEDELIRFIGAKTKEERDKIAERSEELMEFSKWIDEYVNDEQTLRIYGEWNERIQREAAREEAKEEGYEEGSNHEKYGIAKKLLATGADTNYVHEITGLSINDIKNIR